MNVFPVFSSILSAVHIAGFVKDAYKLEGTVTTRILTTGINHTYLVTAGAQKFIFRVYSHQWRTEKEILEEIRLLQLLKENELPVAYAIADAASVYLQQLQAPEGLRFAVLFSFAKGGKLLNFSAELHYKLGEIMARMHKVTQHLQVNRVTYTPEVLLQHSFEQLTQFLPADTEEMIYIKSLQAYLLTAFNGPDVHELRRGVVHIDIWFDNISIDGESVTIFDFDFCGNGWLLLDIAYYILQLYSTEKDEHEFSLKRDSFLKGYESVTLITKEEKRLVPAAGAAIYFFYLGVQCSRYDDWSNNFLNEIYLKRFINLLLKKWVNIHQLSV